MTREHAPASAEGQGPRTPRADAVARLVERHGAKVHALALRLCRNGADADDAAQEVFMQAFRRWETFRGDGDPVSWLYAIARRTCARRMKQETRRRRTVASFSQLLPFRETTLAAVAADRRAADVGSASERRESLQAVEAAIATLPEHFRLVIIFKEVLELSVAETAALLGLKEETVKTRLHRSRLALRQTLAGASRRVPAPAPLYERQVCLDLLKAKLNAMDEGRPVAERLTQSEVCARCRGVFRELDMVQEACAGLARGSLPAHLRRSILRAIDERDRAERSQAPVRRGRRPVASAARRAR